jgi:hypothetical protein
MSCDGHSHILESGPRAQTKAGLSGKMILRVNHSERRPAFAVPAIEDIVAPPTCASLVMRLRSPAAVKLDESGSGTLHPPEIWRWKVHRKFVTHFYVSPKRDPKRNVRPSNPFLPLSRYAGPPGLGRRIPGFQRPATTQAAQNRPPERPKPSQAHVV